MSSAQAEFESLARCVGTLTDDRLRVTFVRHELLGRSAEQVADLFTVAMYGAEGRPASDKRLLQAMSLALADESCDALREAMGAVLVSRQQFVLARALQRAQVEEDSETQRIPDFGKGRTVTLGERKSLARRNDREVIARCLRDPHPLVVRILLGNPSVTESDVVRLCARRPASTEVLREVFRSERWVVRYRVKVALALNPWTPVDVALQLVPHLQRQDLRRLLAASELHEDLREGCRGFVGRSPEVTVH